jgi:hypothetical protein
MASKRGRGRPRLKEAERRSEPVGVRLTRELRSRLEDEAAVDGRSLTQEIELRLRESFVLQKKVNDAFGGKHTRQFLEVMADLIRSIEISAGGTETDEAGDVRIRWLDDPFTYDLVRSMFETVLQNLRPRGRRAVQKALRWHPSLRADVANLGRDSALRALVYLRALKDNPQDSPDMPHPPGYRRAASLLGRPTSADPARELKARQRKRWGKFPRGATSEEGGRRMEAIIARFITVRAIAAYLQPRLRRGPEVDMATIFAGVTGANFENQKQVIVGRIKDAAQGRFKPAVKIKGEVTKVDVDGDLKQILDADRSRALGDEILPADRYRDWSRKGRAKQ